MCPRSSIDVSTLEHRRSYCPIADEPVHAPFECSEGLGGMILLVLHAPVVPPIGGAMGGWDAVP